MHWLMLTRIDWEGVHALAHAHSHTESEGGLPPTAGPANNSYGPRGSGAHQGFRMQGLSRVEFEPRRSSLQDGCRLTRQTRREMNAGGSCLHRCAASAA